MDEIARGLATAALASQSALLLSLVADDATTPHAGAGRDWRL
jgi:hypothetical protein